MLHKRLWFALLVVVLALSVVSPAFAQDDGAADLATGADVAVTIPDRYIVVFADGTDRAAVDAALMEAEAAAASSLDAAGNPQTLSLHYRYDAALVGFAASMPASSLDALKKNPNVVNIEADQIITLSATQSPVTWGLDRIDQRNLPLSNSYTYNNTGAGVTAYIVDTGILFGHTEFGARASFGYDAFGGNGADCNGHGTHVAGTVGGSTYGVAKGVTLKAVRVLNCSGSGTNSGVIAGVNWVASHHAAGAPAVANMSLGGSVSSALDTAVKNAINDGVTFAVAAGNSNRNACNYSPARVAAAITVGATTSSDARASYSNYGSCLDLFAPGSSITSAWYTSTSANNTISGTSMATPHVAGVAALYLQSNTSASPATVRDAIVNNATTGKVTSPGSNSPNRLLFTAY
ncbi:MAG TPA: S8 family peptidase [Anaerolineae bacterium]|nr:S8 family peptidase [Anaerolineae bacterium]